MRQVREVLRLRTAGVGLNEIARRVGVGPSTVRSTLKRLASAGLSWPLPAEMTDTALEAALFAAAGTKQGHRRHVEPDWAEIHRELKRKHVTLTILWDEYIERCCLSRSRQWEAERDALLAKEHAVAPAPAVMLLDIKGIGPEFAAILVPR
jgi:DNA-binding IclR family transcriptional regulator